MSCTGVYYEIPYAFNPPCFVSICENDDNNIDASISQLKKYLLNRETYLRKIITIDSNFISEYHRKKAVLSGYTFTSTFIGLMDAVKEMLTYSLSYELITNGLFFRRYLAGQPGDTESGFLGPDYIDSMFFTPGMTGISPNVNDYGFLRSEYEVDDVRMIYQAPKLDLEWKYTKKPFIDHDNTLYNLIEMINSSKDAEILTSGACFYKYRNFGKSNHSMLKYMDIRKTMEKEFMPQMLTNDEWIEQLNVETVEPLSCDEINLRINDYFKETRKIYDKFRGGYNTPLPTLLGIVLPPPDSCVFIPDVVMVRRYEDVDEGTMTDSDDDNMVLDIKRFQEDVGVPIKNNQEIKDRYQRQNVPDVWFDAAIPPELWHMTLNKN